MRAAACVVGADGYLGQFVVDDLSREDSPFDVVYALARRESTTTTTSDKIHRVVFDITSAESCADAVRAMTNGGGDDEQLLLVVNCAAMSSPGACEKDPKLAEAVNAPSTLWTATATATGENAPLWIQLSTDHVYDGTRAMSDEHVTPAPVNAYGASKVLCEETLAREYPRSVVLRSSIITGPKPPLLDVQRTLFLDFIRDSFEKSERTTFYEDEFRSPICVYDVCAVIRRVYARPPETPKTYNMGGPDRVSRVDMAEAVAAYLANGDAALEAAYVEKIARASCEEAARLRGVAAPPDISMDSSALLADVCGDAPPRSFAKQIIASLPRL